MEFSISEIASFFSNTKGAIRFYEEQGLICPRRDNAGNRVYDYRDFFQLFYLKRYQKVGFTIKDTAEFFTSKSQHSLHEVSELSADRQRAIQEQIAFLKQCDEWLAQYRKSLAKIERRDFSIEEKVMEDFYYLDEDFLSQMDRSSKKVLAEWIAWIPFVTLHIDMVPQGEGFISRTGIGVFARHAKACGLTIPKQAKFMPKARVLTCIVEKTGKDFETDLSEDLRRIYERINQPVYQIPSYSLIYSHDYEGCEKKYYQLFVPVGEADREVSVKE